MDVRKEVQKVWKSWRRRDRRVRRLHFLPPYCPDPNKIERSWKDLHDNVTRNHQSHSINELMRQVRKYLRKHQRELAAQYAAEAA